MHVYFRNNKLSPSFYLLFICTLLHELSLNLLKLVQTMLESFCAAKKIIPERASVHTQKWLVRPDVCDGAKLRPGSDL